MLGGPSVIHKMECGFCFHDVDVVVTFKMSSQAASAHIGIWLMSRLDIELTKYNEVFCLRELHLFMQKQAWGVMIRMPPSIFGGGARFWLPWLDWRLCIWWGAKSIPHNMRL